MTKPLDRYLSPLDVWAMAFGCMVGWGVFAMPGKIIVTSIIIATMAYISMTLISVASVPDGFSSWMDYVAGLDGLKGIDSVPTFHVAKPVCRPM